MVLKRCNHATTEDPNLGGIVGHKLLLHAGFQSVHPSRIAQNLQTGKRH